LGNLDGNHFIPFKDDRIWSETPKVERKKCLISSAVVGAFLSAYWLLSGKSLLNYSFFYWAPHVVFGWWLVAVTYLQHHGPDTVAYADKDWKYVDAAFQTIDRKFGMGIDTLAHHITDGHVVHHLFFTKIPHYNLPMATRALRDHLEKNNLGWLYKLDKTYDFPMRLHKYVFQNGFRAVLATSSPHRA
jgi:omega-3 fatty acid desaturase (delta-15 desaturase)